MIDDGPDGQEEGKEDGEEDFNLPDDFNPWMKSQKQILEEKIRQKREANDGQNDDQEPIVPSDIRPPEVKEIKSSYFNKKNSHPEEAESSDDDDVQMSKDDDQKKLVSEAFADDDVVVDFQKEKDKLKEDEDPKDTTSYLAGWGEWAGPGFTENRRKKENFTVKANKKKRKDSHLGNVIISEKKNESIAKFMVKQVPFPFRSVPEFESSISQPIGRTWNTEMSFRQLIEPNVVTRMGTIIEPMDEESLPKMAKKSFAKKNKKKT